MTATSERSSAKRRARNRLEPLDRVNGGLIDWPGGQAAYAYGLGFHAYLADRYGDDRFAALAAGTARRVPYTASSVFQDVYGRSLGSLWREYETNLLASVSPVSTDGEARRLTRHGFIVSGPRFVPSTCATCPSEVMYSLQTPHDFPSLNLLALDGSAPQRVTTRFLGSTTAIGRDTVYFDQQDIVRNAGLYSDLYALDPRNRARQADHHRDAPAGSRSVAR